MKSLTFVEQPQHFHAWKSDPLWSEPVSTPQCCASYFCSFCQMKVVYGSHRDTLSCLWRKGLGSEYLLPEKMSQSERKLMTSNVLQSFEIPAEGSLAVAVFSPNIFWSKKHFKRIVRKFILPILSVTSKLCGNQTTHLSLSEVSSL